MTFPYTYTWGNNEKRATYKGRRCRILARGTMRSVLIEFENGERTVSSVRSLRRSSALAVSKLAEGVAA